MDSDPLKTGKNRRWSERYSLDDSAIWHDPMADSTPSGSSSVTLLPLSDKYEVFSNFGDQDCGEPSKSQHIVLDFTPDPETDTQEAQEKCVMFWDFIKSNPYLQHMCVAPIKERSPVPQKIAPVEVNNTQAINVLDRDSHSFVRFAFGEKKAQSKCTLGSDSYSEEDPTARGKTAPVKSAPIIMCSCSGICSKCKKAKPRTPKGKEPVAKKLNKIFDEWDKQHPKSMDPPGPVMQHKPTLQRKLPPDQEPKTCFD